MTTRRPTASQDPFELALSTHLKTLGSEPVPPRLATAVDREMFRVAPERRTGWAGAAMLHPRSAVTTLSAIGIIGLLAVATFIFLGGTNDDSPGLIAPPGASPSHSAQPQATPRLDAEGSFDPELLQAIDALVGDIEMPEATPLVAVSSTLEARTITTLPDGSQPNGLVRGPRQGAYYIDDSTASVWRARPKDGAAVEIAKPGDGPERTDLTAAGPDVVIVDDTGRPWRWRPSDSKGGGVLRSLKLTPDPTFGKDHGPLAAYDPDLGDYRLYVVEPSQDQIMRYQQSFDGRRFTPPSTYLASANPEIDKVERLFVDFDVFALIDQVLRRYAFGRWDGAFSLGDVPALAGAQPVDFRLLDGSRGAREEGRLYLYDAANRRIIGFDRKGGDYVAEWTAEGSQLDDVRGTYVTTERVEKKDQIHDTLSWITPQGLFQAPLTVPSRGLNTDPTSE